MTTTPRRHSPYSPSRLKALEISPAFEEDPDAEEHPITIEGQLCHAAVDTGDLSKLTTDEQRAWVAACREYAARILPDAETVLTEERLDIVDGQWGFADCIKIAGDTAALIDYKFGFHPQEDVERNPAAQAYVLGILMRWPDVQTVRVSYLYPRAEEVSHHIYVRSRDMARIETRIRIVVDKAKMADQESCTWSADTCKYCQHRYICPTLRAEVLPIAERYAKTHSLPVPAFDDLATLTEPEIFARLLSIAPVLEAVAESIRRKALALRLERGVEIPGYELRTRAGLSKILNAVLAWEASHALVPEITEEEFLATAEVSWSKLRDLAAAKAGRGKGKKVTAQLATDLKEVGALDTGREVTYLHKSREVPEEKADKPLLG